MPSTVCRLEILSSQRHNSKLAWHCQTQTNGVHDSNDLKPYIALQNITSLVETGFKLQEIQKFEFYDFYKEMYAWQASTAHLLNTSL